MMKVSVIITAYNSEKELDQSILSVTQQTAKDLEIIVVDDGSTDNTRNVISQWEHRDNRVVSLRENNSGVSVARNNGLDKAQGDLVVFVDADDYLPKDAIAKYITFMTRYIDADICFGNALEITPRGEMSRRSINSTKVEYETRYDIDRIISCCLEGPGFSKSSTTKYTGSVWGKAFRLEFLRKHNMRYKPELVRAQDIDFVIRCLSVATKIVHLDDITYCYKVIEGSNSHKRNANLNLYYRLFLLSVKTTVDQRENYDLENDYNYMVINLGLDIIRRNVDGLKQKRNTIRNLFKTDPYRNALKHVKTRSVFMIKENIKILLFRIHFYSVLAMMNK